MRGRGTPGGSSGRARLAIAAGVVTIAAAAGFVLWRLSARRPAPPARYAGAATCAGCHPAEHDLWRRSHHALAMRAADSAAVLGDFGGAMFQAHGVTTTFRRAVGRFEVTTDGPDGSLATFPVAYTFGAYPLQQYLIPFPAGRLQALSVAWDTRPREAGGQRWFHLYPNDTIAHGDVLHWTGPLQNWNTMCAECHSTNLRKNFVLAENRYDPGWTDIAVACEACHGPGSRHVEWAADKLRGRADPDPLRGLTVSLAGSGAGEWAFDPGASIARRSRALPSRTELETCAPCHSRRSPIRAGARPGEPLEQSYRLALLEDSLYFADGQIRDEVYEYGSFVQSRMHRAGVTCSDCHEPHAGTLRAQGNALCARCHLPATYDNPRHHFHSAGTEGAKCVSCHMPERHYMVVDGRRDHSFRVPRPDLSVRIGTPNACNQCHTDRPRAWAAAAVERWYGPEHRSGWHWAEAIHAGRGWRAGAEAHLVRALGDTAAPPIARATALSVLAGYPGPGFPRAVEAAAGDPDPLVRRAPAEGLGALEPTRRLGLGARLLGDPIRSVRFEAFSSLLGTPREAFSSAERPVLDRVEREYRGALASLADRAESHLKRGVMEAGAGRFDSAEAAYRTAIRLQPMFIAARVNLADLQRQQGRDDLCVETLREAIRLEPLAAEAHEALGLALVRQKKLEEALLVLAEAARLRPGEPRFAYVHAVALHDAGEPQRAIEALELAQERYPTYREIIEALVAYHREAGDEEAAAAWARRLPAP